MGFKMTDILPPAGWPNVRQLETNEFASGGANGNMNEQAKSLAARSELLKQYAALPYESKTGGYALNERVQLENGDIVKSTIEGNTNDPNVDVTGWVSTTDASFVVDGDKTQKQINDNQEKLNTILNKTGTTETLAESVDATPFLQSLINAMPDGMTLDLLGKTFRVKKNTGFISDYPSGAQPCLVVKDKKNITITNGKLIVKEHAQTAIDCINSSGVINGLIIEGAGNFPPLYRATGRGEKGEASAGYFNAALYNSGQPRNNSVNTSGYTGGNYGANGFPQWGGGNAATWGVWNGGYIFNIGDGIYLKNSDFKVEACEIYGFNGNAIAISEGSLFVKRSKLHSCYTAGVWAKAYAEGAGKKIKQYIMSECEVYDVGHPDSKYTDDYVDPGYGISTSNSGTALQGVIQYIVRDNTFRNCKRKAVDAHHSYSLVMDGNLIEDCGNAIQIAIGSEGRAPVFTSITNNYIKKIRPSVLIGVSGISVRPFATTNLFTGNTVITGNILEDVGMDKSTYDANKSRVTNLGYGIVASGVESVIISNNTLINPEDTVLGVGIGDGQATADFTPRTVITSNYIRGAMLYAIFSRKNTNNVSNSILQNVGIVADNIVDMSARYDLAAGTQAVAIFTDKAHSTKNNLVVTRPNVQRYWQPNYSGSRVTFDVNMTTGTVSNIVNSELTNFTAANFVVSKPGNVFSISVPQYKSISVLEMATPTTASVYGVRYETGASTSTSIALGLYSNVNGVAVSVDTSALTRGDLRITLELM